VTGKGDRKLNMEPKMCTHERVCKNNTVETIPGIEGGVDKGE
jgi:hypothetical protein